MQDLVLKWRSRAGVNGADGVGDGAASAAFDVNSSLGAKAGVELEGTVAERRVSLLGADAQRSSVLV